MNIMQGSGSGTNRAYRPPVPPKPMMIATGSVRPSAPPPPQHRGQVRCCVCNRHVKAWKCVQCDDSFCAECWPTQRPHHVCLSSKLPKNVQLHQRARTANVSFASQPGKVGIDGRQHEMVDIEVIQRLSKIFSQPTREEQNYRHELDINTTWFGVVNEANQPFLQYSNRIADILQESQIGEYRERFPHLVSFVGQTGTSLSRVDLA